MISVGHFHYCFFESSETFIYHQLSYMKRYRPVAVSLLSKNLDKFVFNKGVLYETGIPLPRPGMQFITPFRYISLKLSAELFKREKISLLHAHFGTWGAYSMPLKNILRLPMAVTFYGQDVSLLPKRAIWRSRYEKLFKKCDLFFAEGPFMKKALVALGAPAEKIVIQRIGIPLEKIRVRQHKGISGLPKALWVGRMIEKKGILDAVKAVEILRDNGTLIELRIVGDGPERAAAESYVASRNLKNISFLGFLNYNDYLKEFEDADFFLAPSKTSKEGETEGGAPTTILEAQARGLPVVSTIHADIPFILPPEYPYLAQENNCKDLASKIIDLLKDVKEWPRISREGRKFVEDFHDIRLTVDSLERCYDTLLTKKH